jgi:hypothetical protein
LRAAVFLSFLLLLHTYGCVTHYHKDIDNQRYLYLKKADAQQVYFASSLDRFKPHRADMVNGYTWVVRIPKHKSFRYFYIVDGKTFLPPCKARETDDFGSQNCLFIHGL